MKKTQLILIKYSYLLQYHLNILKYTINLNYSYYNLLFFKQIKSIHIYIMKSIINL
jgi:hypothetical protein